jgi:hypothetical protein
MKKQYIMLGGQNICDDCELNSAKKIPSPNTCHQLKIDDGMKGVKRNENWQLGTTQNAQPCFNSESRESDIR